MATIVRTPSAMWKAVIRKQGWPTKAKTFRTKRDAEDWARRTEDDMVRGLYIERGASERLTLAKALTRYLSEVTPTKKASTQQTDHWRARPLFEFFGAYALAAITPDLVAEYRDKRLSTPNVNHIRTNSKNPGLLSASTVRLELALLGHLYTTAIREWRLGLTQNPVAVVRKPKPSERDRRLNEGEESKLFAAVDAHSNPMFGWIVRIAIETGMRSSEIASLRLSQVDLSRRVVRLADTKNDSARTVPLSPEATRIFSLAVANPARPQGCALVFFGEPGRDGVRRPYIFKKIWRDMKNKLGLPDLRFHDLRHEAVSRLVEGGLSDQEVSTISGHKSMQMLKRYTHLRAENLVTKLDRIQETTRNPEIDVGQPLLSGTMGGHLVDNRET